MLLLIYQNYRYSPWEFALLDENVKSTTEKFLPVRDTEGDYPQELREDNRAEHFPRFVKFVKAHQPSVVSLDS